MNDSPNIEPDRVSLKRSTLIVGALLLAIVSGSVGYQWRTGGGNANNYSDLSTLEKTLRADFDGNVDSTKLLDGARSGLVDSLGDPYTTYLTKQAATQLKDDLNGSLSGIGIEVGFRNNHLAVVAPIADTPAAKAGLQAKDEIVKIDGKDPVGLTLDEAVAKIRGKAGTTVTLTIVRAGGEPFDVKITRADINVPSVTWKLDGTVGVIKIARFGDDTVTKTKQAATELSAQGATKYVLDLRDNPGGYLDGAVGVSQVFMENKVVVEERKGGKTQQTLRSGMGGALVGKPVVVLVNGGSASASEIVAGALQDQGVAKLVGEKTFGKGSVQQILNLGGGAQLKVTIAHWFTPKGRGIDKLGIAPDVEVKLTQADRDADADPQLAKAKELLAQ